jgi:N-methylhydantoinase A
VNALDREFGERFRAAHAAAYGYDIPGRAVEIVTLRLKIVGVVKKPHPAAVAASVEGKATPTAQRAVYFDAATGWLDTPVYERSRLSIGAEIAGPAVIEEMSATTLLRPGQRATTDAAGNLIVTVFAG